MRELFVIEDSDDDFDSFSRTCERVAFDGALVRFRNAEDALAHLRALDMTSVTPRLILLDLNLPGMDGRELLEILKGDPTLRAIPAVVFTTSDNEKDLAFCYHHHANAYHLKPMDVDALEREVYALIDYWFRRVVPAA